MQPKNKDSIANTFIVAILVCLVCSLLVSSAAVLLKPKQDRNVELDKMNNILKVAGFSDEEIDSAGIEDLFKERFEIEIINLETGQLATEEEMKETLELMKVSSFEAAKTKYDAIKAAKTKDPIAANGFEDKKQDIAGLSTVEKFTQVYKLMDPSGSNVEQYVFPIRGYGLWSTLKGFLSVNPDFQTITGLTYYEHAETPGLGGEVDNDNWKAQWAGKTIYGPEGNVKIKVVKGSAGDDPYGVDGLSGATITSNGVTNMLQYWLGDQGFGPYIQRQKSNSSTASLETSSNLGDSNG